MQQKIANCAEIYIYNNLYTFILQAFLSYKTKNLTNRMLSHFRVICTVCSIIMMTSMIVCMTLYENAKDELPQPTSEPPFKNGLYCK